MLPTEFAVRVSNGRFKTPPHIKCLEQFVVNQLKTPDSKGAVCLPIRHGKSEFISKYLPAYYLLTYPERHIILCGYGNDFAEEWGAKARDIFTQWSPAYGLTIGSKKRADHWTTSEGGSMRTCGANGPITGKGCHLLIADDIVKSQADANSPTCRNKIHTWWMSDAQSRLEPSGQCIMVLSRRHPDDILGRLLQSNEWKTLRIPAIAEEGDILGRTQGEALWSERYSITDLERIRAEYELQGQGFIWECLYQQNPLGDPSLREFPPEYTNDVWVDRAPENFKYHVLALDPSKGRHSKQGDYSAFVELKVTEDGMIYVNSWLMRFPIDQLQTYAVNLLNTLRPQAFIYEKIFEQGKVGKGIQEQCSLLGVPCPLYEFTPKSSQDKVERIRLALTPLLGQKKLKLVREPSFSNQLLLAQIKELPSGVYDDGADALTIALEMLERIKHGPRKQPPPLTLKV